MNKVREVVDSRYMPIPQKKYHCVPAVIQMIMQKHGLTVPTQDVLGYHLGVVVPANEADDLDPVRVGTGPEVGVGTQLQKPEYDFNTVAKHLGLGLKMTCLPPDNFASEAELAGYLSDAEKADKDIVVCYDFATRYQNGTGGHVNLLDRVLSLDCIRLIEPIVYPGLENHLWRETNTDQLLQAMTVHSEWMGGVWEIELT